MAIAVALGGVAVAQNATVEGGASAQSSTSVTADRGGASASQQGAAAASATSDHGDAAAQAAHGGELSATLSRPVDAGRAKPGDEVTATLSQHYESNGDVMLRRGTKLVGHVTEAAPRQRRSAEAGGNSDSRLGIVFDKAVLEDGREVPLNATIQAVAAAEAMAASSTRGFDGAASGGAAGAGRATGGLAGGVAGSAGGALGGVGRVGGGLGGAASGAVGGAARSSAGAMGGLNAAGRLMSGSRGAFGMSGIDVASAATSNANGSVLTSRARDVELERGTQMLLVSQASGGAQGAVQGTTRGATATGSAAGSAQGAVQGTTRGASAAGSASGSAATGVSTIRR
jgi:hypothetical protein